MHQPQNPSSTVFAKAKEVQTKLGQTLCTSKEYVAVKSLK